MPSWRLMEDTLTMRDRLKMAAFCLTTKQFTNGPKVAEFENEWNEWLGSHRSLFVSSGSTANFLLVASIIEKYGLKRGDKVLLPACTWMTNVAPIIQLGLQPIFCDINLKDFSFDVDNMTRISELHPDIKLIFITHLLGFPANNNEYRKVFPDAIIIDDVCESHGAIASDGSKVGSDSTGATFSFYFGHHMTTIEGGMVSTNDEELYDIMKMKRSHGLARESVLFDRYASENSHIDKKFLFVTDGYNFRNHELCAVIGISQLKKLDSYIDTRRRNYSQFLSVLEKYDHMFYQPGKNSGNSSFCLPLIAKHRDTYDRLRQQFDNNDIEYRPVVGGNLLAHPFLRDYEIAGDGKNNNVDILQNNGLYLGNSQFVGEKNIRLLDSILGDLDGNR